MTVELNGRQAVAAAGVTLRTNSSHLADRFHCFSKCPHRSGVSRFVVFLSLRARLDMNPHRATCFSLSHPAVLERVGQEPLE